MGPGLGLMSPLASSSRAMNTERREALGRNGSAPTGRDHRSTALMRNSPGWTTTAQQGFSLMSIDIPLIQLGSSSGKFTLAQLKRSKSVKISIKNKYLKTTAAILTIDHRAMVYGQVDQGHWVQFLQLHDSMANVQIYKYGPHIFDYLLPFQRSNNFKYLPNKVGQDHRVQFLQLHHSMANVKMYKCITHIFAPALTICEKLIF